MTPTQKIHHIVSRSKTFYEAADPGHFLVQVRFPHDKPNMQSLTAFDLDHDLERWLDQQLAVARATWAAKAEIDDDCLPCLCPRFGIAEHSAWLGARVRLQDDTCLPIPMLNDKDDLRLMRPSEQNNWFQYMQRGYAYLKSKQNHDFLLSVRGTMAPMDVANALRGDALFLDFYDDPEFVHRLMRFLRDAILWYYHHLISWADPVQGGHAMFLADFWFPAGLGHLTNDAAMLCGPDIYRTFGRPYEEEMCRGYSHVLYHVHNEKMHFVPMVASLPGIRLLQISWDPQTRPQLEDLANIFALTGTVPLMLHALNTEQVRAHIEELAQRNVLLVVDCQDRQDAEDILAFVRHHSKPLV